MVYNYYTFLYLLISASVVVGLTRTGLVVEPYMISRMVMRESSSLFPSSPPLSSSSSSSLCWFSRSNSVTPLPVRPVWPESSLRRLDIPLPLLLLVMSPVEVAEGRSRDRSWVPSDGTDDGTGPRWAEVDCCVVELAFSWDSALSFCSLWFPIQNEGKNHEVLLI